ncbi:MAG: Asp-tRNA(Asn)/Glu-tRNA(Gln) amidotransferase subunit GatC [Opitutia bacterium]|jgi:aspartyl-tRNA(Asn)/glutamyl-tRNA(Gln) amidotransferase subunit C
MSEGFDIRHLAKLARLRLTPEEEALYASQLGSVLGHFRALAEADLPPAADEARAVAEGALRSDEPGPVLGPDAVTRVAPSSKDGQVSVPRVVDDES